MLVEDLDYGADGDGRVVAVEEVEVYVVRPEADQGVVEVARDIEGGHPLAVLVVVGALADYYDLFAQAAIPYPTAEGPLAVPPPYWWAVSNVAPPWAKTSSSSAKLRSSCPSSSDRIITVPCTIRATGFSTPGTLP